MKNMSSNTATQDTSILNRLNHIEISEQPTVSELLKGCARSQYICILTQHVKNAIPIGRIKKNNANIYFLLYQVYFALNCMRHNYTHYDLHRSNVLCYQPVPNKYIHFMYHLKNGEVFDFITMYLAYIIDYGRSFFYDNEKYNSVVVHKTICDAKCPTVCGKEEGFGILHGDGITHKKYNINSQLNNCSADLRLLDLLQQNEYIHISEEIIFETENGTPQCPISGLPNNIHNISDALQVISNKVLSFKDKIAQSIISNNYTKLGTLHIYENGKTPAHFEKE